MQELFQNLGFKIEKNGLYLLNFSKQSILHFEEKNFTINGQAIATNSRLLQIPLLFAKIEELVQKGFSPDKIALILPDESFAPIIKKYDKMNNLNFAMGFSFENESCSIELKRLYEALKGSSFAKEYLKALGINLNLIDKDKIKVKDFFTKLSEIGLSFYQDLEKNLEELNLLEKLYLFKNIFREKEFEFKDWLFLWIEFSKSFRIDDIRAGRVTAIGLLESRGVSFDAVVIIDFNEGIVPKSSKKDRFLNSAIRKKAKLPTRADRENLQKHYYASLLSRAKESVIIFVEDDENAPSKFLYELGIDNFSSFKEPMHLLYKKGEVFVNSHLESKEIAFDAKSFLWSNSKLKSFLKCKRLFYYRYIAKLKMQEESINEGKILHEILAKLLAPKKSYETLEELKKAFDMAIDALDYEDFEIEYKKILWKEKLTPFLKSQIEHFKNGWQIISCEKEVTGQINGLNFHGIIDRIDKKENQYLIIDYKSASIDNKKDAQKTSDFQLVIYDLLFSSSNKDVVFLDLFNARFIELKSFEEKKEKLFEHIKKLKNTKKIVLHRCEDLSLCRFCEYRLLCHRGEYL